MMFNLFIHILIFYTSIHWFSIPIEAFDYIEFNSSNNEIVKPEEGQFYFYSK